MNQYPEHNALVTFTDLLGIQRKGIYNAEKRGFQESSELEMPTESEFFIPEDEVSEWQPDSDSQRID
ncbi:MAG TPA: hypothetical protein VGN64_06960 [Dyadobacter sp.]|jgi:hypothetical protein|nr:hypothetical protein [Dyadobacter sp.]